MRCGLARCSVPRRDGKPQHVGQRAAVAIGDSPGQLGDLGRQHRLGRYDALEEAELPLMIATRQPGEDESGDELTGEAHAYLAAGYRGSGQRVRHEVVKWPVQVRQRDVNRDARHRQLGGRLPGSTAW